MSDVFDKLNRKSELEQNHTGTAACRVRITATPRPQEFDEYDVRRFAVGEVYELSPRLATLLVLGGYAEPVTASVPRAEAADRSSRSKKRD